MSHEIETLKLIDVEDNLSWYSRINCDKFLVLEKLDKNNAIYKKIWDEAFKQGFEYLKENLD